MNKDIRLSVNFFDHPKTVKLQRRLGIEAIVSLQRLWLWAAQNRPEGVLHGMDSEDIEISAKWGGEQGVFYDALLSLGWVDVDDNVLRLHDWEEHNPWQSEAKARSEKASNAAKARWGSKQVNANVCSSNAQASTKQCPSPLLSSPNQEELNTNTPPKAPQAETAQDTATENTCSAGVCDEPHFEFVELRELYDREGVSEAPLAGLSEFKTLCKHKEFPGIGRITQAICEFEQQDDRWQRCYRPNLGRFLKEKWWLKQPQKARAAPQSATQQTRESRDGEALAAVRRLQQIQQGGRNATA